MAVLRNEQVLGFQVPMDDALLVGGGEALDHLQRVVDGLPLRDRTRVELAPQRLALQQLRHRIGRPVLGSEVVNGQDVRMRQRRDRLGFALEPRQRVRILRHRVRKHLDRDVPVELPVARPVNLSHAPRAQRREDLVGPEARSSCQCQCGV